MEKRFIVFIVLSFLIMAGWQVVVSRFYPAEQPAVEVTNQPQQAPTVEQSPAPQSGSNVSGTSQTPSPTTVPTTAEAATQPNANTPVSTSPKSITVETPLWRAVFNNQGGVVKSFTIKTLPGGREILAGDYTQLELISQEGLQKVGAPFRLELEHNEDLTKKLNSSYYNVDAAADTLQLDSGDQKDLIFSFQDCRQCNSKQPAAAVKHVDRSEFWRSIG